MQSNRSNHSNLRDARVLSRFSLMYCWLYYIKIIAIDRILNLFVSDFAWKPYFEVYNIAITRSIHAL